MLNVNEIVTNILSSINFNKQLFIDRDNIDWSIIDLSSIPSADLTDILTKMDYLSSKLSVWETQIKESRISSCKKEKGLGIVSSILKDINTLNKNGYSDLEYFNYEISHYIRLKLENLILNVPASCKEEIKRFYSSLKDELNKVATTEQYRHYILSELRNKIIEKAHDYRVEEQKEDILASGLSIQSIEEADDVYLDAACVYAYEQYGKGANALVREIFYAKKRNYKYITLSWPFSDEVENIVKCAKALNVKEFAFTGDSTAALRTLNLITKLGLFFRIEEVDQKNFGAIETVPVAVVTL